jgi:para-nitrobenzyl esterase
MSQHARKCSSPAGNPVVLEKIHMRMRLLALGLLLAAACGGDPDELTITLDSGTIHGGALDGIRHFFGIPYAAAPLGANRFRAPQPVAPWSDVRPAIEIGSQCPQSISLAGSSDDEDCLFVNVWAPSGAHDLPVMVWLHGGAFIIGSGGDKYYDGGRLASSGVIVVTVNYRLGLFGFLAHPALRTDDPAYPTAGNYGLEDQHAALEWVQRNIAAFGGDPKHVTLFGESAGGMSTCVHYLSSRSHGLFVAAIAESGLCSSPLLEIPRATAEAQATMLAETLGCPGADASTLDCLRGKSPDELLAATPLPASSDPPGGPIYQPQILPGSLPTVDGYVIEQPMAAALAAAQFEPRPLILGNVKDEGTLFHSPLFAQPVPDEAAYRAALAMRFAPPVVDGIVAHYPVNAFSSANRALAQVTGDAYFLCPSRRFARGILARGAVLYRYSFEQPLAQPFAPDLGVFHSSELPFVFGNDTFPLGRIGDATALSTAMQQYWTQFAKLANPNAAGGVAWPVYDNTEPQLVLASPTITTGKALDDDACAFWDAQAL